MLKHIQVIVINVTTGGAFLHEHQVVIIIKKKHVINILDFTDVVLGYEQQRTSHSTISMKKIQCLDGTFTSQV